jgi:hypothetical protein
VSLFLSLIFSAVGSGYLIYGKRQYDAAFAVCGVLLCVYGYFFSSAAAIVLIGALLAAVPFVLQRLN